MAGNETKDLVVKGLGTTLRYLPAARFDEELAKVEASEEGRAMADHYGRNAQEIVEPKPQDLLDAAKNYVVCKRILDEGIAAGREADVNAVLSMLLTQLLRSEVSCARSVKIGKGS